MARMKPEKRRGKFALKKTRPKPTAVWATVEILAAQDLPKERVKLHIKAYFEKGEPSLFTVIWRPPRDALSMFSVVRRAGVPISKTKNGYSFDSGYLVGQKVAKCALSPDKKPGRVRLFHPDEREQILKTGKIETPPLL